MYPSVESTRSARTLLVILVAILVAGSIASIWLWTRSSTQPAPEQGRAVAENFLQQVRENKAEAAWESTTAEFKSAQGRESFVKEAKSAKYLAKPMEYFSANTVTVQDQPRSEYLFRSGEGPVVRIVLGNEAGTWKVDRWIIAH